MLSPHTIKHTLDKSTFVSQMKKPKKKKFFVTQKYFLTKYSIAEILRIIYISVFIIYLFVDSLEKKICYPKIFFWEAFDIRDITYYVYFIFFLFRCFEKDLY